MKSQRARGIAVSASCARAWMWLSVAALAGGCVHSFSESSEGLRSQDTRDYVVRVVLRRDVIIERTTSWWDSYWEWQFGWVPIRSVSKEKFHKENKNLPAFTSQGSAWLIADGKRPILVTAKHVVLPDRGTISGLVPASDIIVSKKVQVVFGRTAVRPREIGVASARRGSLDSSGVQDLVFVRPDSASILKEARPLSLAGHLPATLEKVTVIGFPGTDFPQNITAEVTSVSEDKGFFVLNKELPPGVSGGAVVDAAHKCYGVVSSTTKDQTTVLLVTSEVLKKAVWVPAATLLNEP